MKCQVCNREVTPAAAFCSHCGAKLAATASTKAGAVPSPGDEGASRDPSAGLASRRRAADTPEEILWEGSYSPKAMLGPLALAAVATLALMIVAAIFANGQPLVWSIAAGLVVVIWLVLGVRLAAHRLGIRYKLTNHMFYHQRGLLTRVTNRIQVIDIDDVTSSQSLLERLVGVGTIRIVSRDRTNPEFNLAGIENVERVTESLDQARRAERVRRGVIIESNAPPTSA